MISCTYLKCTIRCFDILVYTFEIAAFKITNTSITLKCCSFPFVTLPSSLLPATPGLQLEKFQHTLDIR